MAAEKQSSFYGKKWFRLLIFWVLIFVNIFLIFAVDKAWGRICCGFVVFFSCYSWFWFYIGYKDKVIDEQEDGYIKDGLRLMLKSWLWLGIAVVFIKTCTV